MKKYLITSKVGDLLHAQLSTHKPDFALYRDKTNPNYETEAKNFIDICSKFQDIKPLIHQNIELAKQLKSYGVHLTSKQFDKIKEAKDAGLKVIVSTHSLEEIENAYKLQADFVTYSPIFASPNKGKPKGIDDLTKTVKQTNMKIFALGGIIDDAHIEKIKQSKAYGFASIRYFY